MAVFEVATPDGKKFEITAPDQATAMDAFKRMQGGQTPQAQGQTAPAASAPSAPDPNAYHSPLPGGDAINAFANGLAEDIPVLGSLANNAADFVGSHLASLLTGKPADEELAKGKQRYEDSFKGNEGARLAGNVVGTVGPLAAAGQAPTIAKILGMDSSVPLLGRTLASAGSNAAIAGADSAARNGVSPQVLSDAATGGVVGAILPGAGDLIGKGAQALGSKTTKVIDALTNTDRAAQKTVAGAAAQDLRTGQGMTPLDEANAALNGQPIVNADRFGQNVQTLARTAANSSPSADAALKDLTQDRFLTQNVRATSFVKRITGGSVDDLAAQDQIRNAASASNKIAYDKAYASPGAGVVWTPEIRELFQSPDFLSAVRGASGTGANDAAISGFKSVQNPFVFKPDRSVGLKRMANGAVAKPSLQFWDIVQRNLRAGSEKAYRAGDNLQGSQLKQMRAKLLNGLDNAFPDFQQARQGAAAAFGAEDALDAGRQFVAQKMAIPEAKTAYAKFTPAERKAFSTGFASSLIDKIGASSDRVNVINQVFGSPAARSQVELALGKNAAAQLEHFVRVEDIMQQTKQAVQGNSTTAKQLIAAGLVGGGIGGALGGWDPRSMASGAFLFTAGRAGARALGRTVDQKVMQRVAEMLSSGDQNEINRTILNATLSPQHSDAIKAIEAGFQALARGESINALRLSAAQNQ